VDRSSGGRSSSDRSHSDRPFTAAERRALEVRALRAPRAPVDPDHERAKIEARTTEEWIDEGSVREAAQAASARAVRGSAIRGSGGEAQRASTNRRSPRPLDPELSVELHEAVGAERATRIAERLAQASESLDRVRFEEARRVSTAIAKEAPDVAAVQEVLGLACYRLGRYRQAAKALERAHELRPSIALLPVLADTYRGLERWTAVERLWLDIRNASPAQEILAEGRIVAASALADQGDLRGAIKVMTSAKTAKRVREHNLREWYVLADLYDRVGDPIAARRTFAALVEHDPEFADASQRLRTLGR
jgi:tetratricopeptide (TPR) repeat protein